MIKVYHPNKAANILLCFWLHHIKHSLDFFQLGLDTVSGDYKAKVSDFCLKPHAFVRVDLYAN